MIFSKELFVPPTTALKILLGRRIVERANGRDQHSHLVKHAIEDNHLPVVNGDFTILDSG